MKGTFLSKLKKSIVGEDEDGFGAALDDENMDLESGVIRIDDSDPDEVVTTTDVLDEGHGTVGNALAGFGGKVFVVNLQPFFKTMKAPPGSRLANSLVTFSETLISRMIEGRGSFTQHGNDKFFLRLNVSDEIGWSEAANIVNDIGINFLRDAFKPEEFLPQVLGVVDGDIAFDEDGNFDAEKALAASGYPQTRNRRRKGHGTGLEAIQRGKHGRQGTRKRMDAVARQGEVQTGPGSAGSRPASGAEAVSAARAPPQTAWPARYRRSTSKSLVGAISDLPPAAATSSCSSLPGRTPRRHLGPTPPCRSIRRALLAA